MWGSVDWVPPSKKRNVFFRSFEAPFVKGMCESVCLSIGISLSLSLSLSHTHSLSIGIFARPNIVAAWHTPIDNLFVGHPNSVKPNGMIPPTDRYCVLQNSSPLYISTYKRVMNFEGKKDRNNSCIILKRTWPGWMMLNEVEKHHPLVFCFDTGRCKMM